MSIYTIPEKTSIFILDSTTNWWKPLCLKNRITLDNKEEDPREFGWNIFGYTVYKYKSLHIAVDNKIKLIEEAIPW